jgi:hypothetical protein
MRRIVTSGPGADSDLAKHYLALARLREHPCPHIWRTLPDDTKQCVPCGVILNGTMMHYEEETPK